MSRRDWLRAMRRELAEMHGATRLRWLAGIGWVTALALVPALIVAGMLFGVIGGAVGNRDVFLQVYRSGSESWIGALALTVPTALVGITASLLVFARHRAGLTAAYTFAALVAVSAIISIANVAPVKPFLDDWKHVTTDRRATDHADELRINSAIGALGAAIALLVLARRTGTRTRTNRGL